MSDSLRGIELTAKFTGAMVDLEYKEGAPGKCKKTVPIETFLESLSGSIKVTGEMNFYPTGLRVYACNGPKTIVGYEMPERVGPMKFRGFDNSQNGTETLNSVFPWGMTFIVMNNSANGMTVNTFYQFALKNTVTSLGDMMYVWPGSNVYQEHNCCMGSLHVPPMKTIDETGDLPFLFYNGVSNHDLEGNKFRPYTDGQGNRVVTPYYLYRDLEVKEGEAPKQFPYDRLMNAMSVKSFLELRGFLKNGR